MAANFQRNPAFSSHSTNSECTLEGLHRSRRGGKLGARCPRDMFPHSYHILSFSGKIFIYLLFFFLLSLLIACLTSIGESCYLRNTSYMTSDTCIISFPFETALPCVLSASKDYACSHATLSFLRWPLLNSKHFRGFEYVWHLLLHTAPLNSRFGRLSKCRPGHGK